jgi:hypothetical protein
VSKPYNHAIAETKKGYVGRFPPEIQNGDSVCLLSGLDQVAVIRQMGKHYEFVGTCFVAGMTHSKQIQPILDSYSLKTKKVSLK